MSASSEPRPPPPPPSSATSDDLGFRFVAPAHRPVALSMDAAQAAKEAGIPRRLERSVALGLLAYDAYSIERSFFADVAVVPPRVPVVRGADGVLVVGERAGPAVREMTVEEAAAGLRRAIDAAVLDAVSPARRVALALSGGLDSSAVAVSASRAMEVLGRPRDELVLFHYLPREGPSEVEHARAVARAVGRPLVEIPWLEGDPFEGIEPVAAAADVPFDGPGANVGLAQSRRLAAEGVELLLTGDGGDEAVAAYGQGLTGEVGPRDAPVRRGVAGWLRAAARPVYRAMAPWWLKGYRQGMPLWLAWRVRGMAPPRSHPTPLTGLSGVAVRRDGALRSSRQCAIVAWYRALERVTGVRPAIPFLDGRVQDFVLSVPPAHFAAGGRQKGLLRLAYAGTLPREQAQRGKDQATGQGLMTREFEVYGVAWEHRLRASRELAEWDLMPRSAAASVVRAALGGKPASLHRALALLWLGTWLRTRAG